MADNKRPESRQPNQTGSQSGDFKAQQLHREAGGIRNPNSRDKSAHGRSKRIDETGETRKFRGKNNNN